MRVTGPHVILVGIYVAISGGSHESRSVVWGGSSVPTGCNAFKDRGDVIGDEVFP